jgi:hypothetical protein
MILFKFLLIFFIVISQNITYAYGEYYGLPYKYTVSNHRNKIKERIISVGLKLVDMQKVIEISDEESVYNEVISYSNSKPFGDSHGRSTNVHETVHGINNVLRNKYSILSKKKINGFYAGAGKGVVVENPKIVMRDIIPYIPLSVRGYRFNLYFEKQLGDWDSVPTYPIDEWSAYISGAECAVARCPGVGA